MPGAKCADRKAKYFTGFALGFKVGLKVKVLTFLAGNSFFQGFLAVFKGAAHIDNGYLVIILYNNIGAYR